MPLVRIVQGVRFSRFNWEEYVPRGVLEKGPGHPSLRSPVPEGLTRQFMVKGYPTKEVSWNASARLAAPRVTNIGRGHWLLSDVTYETQKTTPVRLKSRDRTADLRAVEASEPEGILWLYQGAVYVTDDRKLTPKDIGALVNLDANRRRLMLEKAHALQSIADNFDRPRRRETIPQAVKVEVWQRDGGRCVECSSRDRLEFDHMIPLSMGGSNTARNLQLLCETCNRRKGASLG